MSVPAVLHPENLPYIEIIEQPYKAHKFRYIQEGRGMPIPGASSTPGNRTSFAIQIHGYQGRLLVNVSCVTKDPPYRQHPYQLVGPNCNHGVCSFEQEVTATNSTITFAKMGARCIKRSNFQESLRIRQENNVDPFEEGFGHKDDFGPLERNVVRLCVQVVLLGDNGDQRIKIRPVVSNPIYDGKAPIEPIIYKLSHGNSYVDGKIHSSEQIILLCTKVKTDDLKIRFFEMKDNEVVWEDFGTFHSDDIYNNTAICFRPPKYHDQNITYAVKVWVQLVRPTDQMVSQPIEFMYLPVQAAPRVLNENRDENPVFDELTENGTRTREDKFVAAEINQTTKRRRTDTRDQLVLDMSSSILQEIEDLIPEVAQIVDSINQTEYSSSVRSTQIDNLTGAYFSRS